MSTSGIDVSARLGTVLTAMVTPFGPDGSLDLAAAKQVATHLVDSGCDGLVVSGTTGESPTTSDDEKLALLRRGARCRRRPRQRHRGGRLLRHGALRAPGEGREAAGAHDGLVVTPYYSRP